VLRELVSRFFTTLVESGEAASVTPAKICVTCRLYRDSIPIEELDATLRRVDPSSEGLTLNQLYKWVVLMFGDCTQLELVSGVEALIDAADSVRGLAFSVGDPLAFA